MPIVAVSVAATIGIGIGRPEGTGRASGTRQDSRGKLTMKLRPSLSGTCALAALAFLAVAMSVAPAIAGSNSLMSVTPDGRWLLVANADNGSVSVVDTSSRKT